jgi:hypothetical protein
LSRPFEGTQRHKKSQGLEPKEIHPSPSLPLPQTHLTRLLGITSFLSVNNVHLRSIRRLTSLVSFYSLDTSTATACCCHSPNCQIKIPTSQQTIVMVIVSGENSRSLHIIMGVCACGRRGEEEEQKQKRSSLSQSTSLSRHRLLEQVDTPALILFAAQASPLNPLHDTDGLISDAIVTTTNLILDRSEHTLYRNWVPQMRNGIGEVDELASWKQW